MDQLLNQQLGNYQIEELLGEGGMGAVYKARHNTLQNDVAIKVMHAQYARQSVFQDRFLQEARIAANLDHPGIVRVSDFGEDKSYLFIVMEYIPGGNLQEFLQNLQERGQWIPLSEAVQLLRRIAQAMDHAHRHGIYHRDIKPANIMVKLSVEERERYLPVVTDLGLAKLTEGGMDTATNTTMGTPAYMSPEQATGDEVDARSDVYSLGVLLYELTVGRRPFPIRTLTEALRYHTREAPPKPRSVNPKLPVQLEQIILKTLEKNPARRFQSARALAQALTSAVPSELGNSLPPTAPAGASSLYTQMQESLIELRGQSLIQEFPETISSQASGSAHIQVMKPDGQAHTVSMNKPTLIIGRGAEADIMLDDEKISRQHATIYTQGNRYLVNDLGSTNGSYLGNNRLQAGKPTEWTPERPLRVGSHNLRLIPAAPTIAEPLSASARNPSQWQTLKTFADDAPTAQRLSAQPQTRLYHEVGTAGSVVPPRPQQKKPVRPEPVIPQKSNARRIFAWASPLILLILVGFGWFIFSQFNSNPPTVPPPDNTDTPNPTVAFHGGIALVDTVTPTVTPINTPTDSSASEPIPVDTATVPPVVPTDTPIPTDTFTPIPADTLTPIPTATDTATSTATPIPTPTATHTPIPSLPTPTHTPTAIVIEPEWVFIPSGQFVKGSDDAGVNSHVADCNASEGAVKGIQCEFNWFADEKPLSQPSLGDFQITKHEITNQEYQQCINAGRCGTRGISSDTDIFDSLDNFDGANRPVIGVSSFDAQDYCSFVGGRLPTEDEWEKAARGTNGNAYPWGNSFSSSNANTCDSSCPLDNFRFNSHNDGAARTANVGSYSGGASPYGVMDMAGNVWEWTSSPHNGQRLIKGGGWSKWFHQSRSAERTEVRPDYENFDIGIRCVK